MKNTRYFVFMSTSLLAALAAGMWSQNAYAVPAIFCGLMALSHIIKNDIYQ